MTSETAQHEASPDARRPWLAPVPVPVLTTEPGGTLYLMRDPATGEELAEPEALGSCPCPLRGRRCWDCSMIAFAPPPFRATPLGWTLATGRRLGWRIRWAIFGPPADADD
jgi:hypothetical protein